MQADLIHDGSAPADTAAALWTALDRFGGWDVLELSRVPRKSGARFVARAAKATRHRVRVTRGALSPYLTFEPGADGLRAALERTDPKFRSNLRRRRRKLESLGAVAFSRGGSLDDFYALEQSGWKGREGSAIAASPDTRRFYDLLAAEGFAALYTLSVDGRAIAMQYGAEHDGTFILLKPAYDEAMRDQSPGQLITEDILEDIAARGGRGYDFGGEAEFWKTRWTKGVRRQATWLVFRGAVGALAEAARFRVRPAVKRLLRR